MSRPSVGTATQCHSILAGWRKITLNLTDKNLHTLKFAIFKLILQKFSDIKPDTLRFRRHGLWVKQGALTRDREEEIRPPTFRSDSQWIRQGALTKHQKGEIPPFPISQKWSMDEARCINHERRRRSQTVLLEICWGDPSKRKEVLVVGKGWNAIPWP